MKKIFTWPMQGVYCFNPYINGYPLVWSILLLMFASYVAMASQHEEPQTSLTQLASYIAEREQLMEYVARVKWQEAGSTVYDAEQELSVLGMMGQSAQDHRLPIVESQLFAQILADLSKQIEAYWFAQFADKSDSLEHESELTLDEIRTQLVDLDSHIIDALSDMHTQKAQPTLEEIEQALSLALSPVSGIPTQDTAQNPVDFIKLLAVSIHSVISS